MRRKVISLFLVLTLTGLVTGCKKKSQVEGVNLAVDFSDEKLSDTLITDMRYIWTTDSDFEKISQDYNIYVQFWHGNNLLFQDDHFPPTPTSQWEPEKEYVYSRRIYIPSFIDEFDPSFKGEETLKLDIGFYSPYDRTGESRREVLSKKLKVIPPPLDTPEIIYEEGWHNLEEDPQSYLKKWRWTAQEARCIIDNPHRDALLVIRGGANLEAVPGQTLSFRINDIVLDEFVPEESHFERSYNIKKDMLGEKEEFILTIATDKIFKPAEVLPDSADERELGVQISFIYFR